MQALFPHLTPGKQVEIFTVHISAPQCGGGYPIPYGGGAFSVHCGIQHQIRLIGRPVCDNSDIMARDKGNSRSAALQVFP